MDDLDNVEQRPPLHAEFEQVLAMFDALDSQSPFSQRLKEMVECPDKIRVWAEEDTDVLARALVLKREAQSLVALWNVNEIRAAAHVRASARSTSPEQRWRERSELAPTEHMADSG